jgi:hypothetical protein
VPIHAGGNADLVACGPPIGCGAFKLREAISCRRRAAGLVDPNARLDDRRSPNMPARSCLFHDRDRRCARRIRRATGTSSASSSGRRRLHPLRREVKPTSLDLLPPRRISNCSEGTPASWSRRGALLHRAPACGAGEDSPCFSRPHAMQRANAASQMRTSFRQGR